MKIFDKAILDLPFFDDRHRVLAAELERWVADHDHLSRDYAGKSAAERNRLYVQLLGTEGWLAHAVDPAPGRNRPDLRTLCLIREALAYMDDLADFAFAIQGLAAAPIAWFGSGRQKDEHLADLRAGRAIGSLALSEPQVGSDLATAALDARKGPDGYVVDGVKTWVSHGNIADYHMVLARTGEGPGGLGLSFLLVPKTNPGLSVTDIDLLAPRAFAGLAFANCALPPEALIGEPGMGFKYAMEILNLYRITVGSAAIGFSRKAFGAAIEWCRNRNVAGSKLIQTQMTKEKLADMAVYLDAASLLVARTAWEVDTGCKNVAVHSSMAKLYATEGAQKVIDDALQLFGAAGLVAGSVPEMLYRQIRSLRIYEGTSEIQKIIISGALTRNAP